MLSLPYGLPRLAWLVLILASAVTTTSAASNGDDDSGSGSGSSSSSATVEAGDNMPEWISDNTLQLKLSIDPSKWLPLQYTVVPVTQQLVMHEPDARLGIASITGQLKLADDSSYLDINSTQDIAFLSCDKTSNDSRISADTMLNALMSQSIKAILLYSTSKNLCAFMQNGNVTFTNVLSLVDPGEAMNVFSYFNGSTATTDVLASISGKTNKHEKNPSPASAMLVLYSITGIVTLLFAAIVAVGAFRAHRHPERYGPSGGAGGRPRQSRAKGLARAMLDTIPVVKFGNGEQNKSDPEIEMQPQATEGREDAPQQAAAAVDHAEGAESGASPVTSGAKAASETNEVSGGASASTARVVGVGESSDAIEKDVVPGSHVGCSICTEDFKVSEDVRLLPCKHQFHPDCIDPWLLNVSGTCPLCRYDLRPTADSSTTPGETSTPEADPYAGVGRMLPPPLALGQGVGDYGGAYMTSHHMGMAPMDTNLLREASRTEQMRTLRQMRERGAEQAGQEPDGEQRRQGARIAAKLRDKFRIRTRAQPAEAQEVVAEQT